LLIRDEGEGSRTKGASMTLPVKNRLDLHGKKSTAKGISSKGEEGKGRSITTSGASNKNAKRKNKDL